MKSLIAALLLALSQPGACTGYHGTLVILEAGDAGGARQTEGVLFDFYQGADKANFDVNGIQYAVPNSAMVAHALRADCSFFIEFNEVIHFGDFE
jgi:hypothetical protein